jgi:hypothetical protein
MPPKAAACFFLDSCVILSKILEENTSRVSKFTKDAQDHHIECYVSDSIVSECSRKINDTVDFLGHVLKGSLEGWFEEIASKDQSSKLEKSDVRIIESCFKEIYKAGRLQYGNYVYIKSVVLAIEEWVVHRFEEIVSAGKEPTLGDLLRELAGTVLSKSSVIKRRFEVEIELDETFAKKTSIAPDSGIEADLLHIGLHSPDNHHVACAVANLSKGTTVFVTFDEGILERGDEVRQQMGLGCVNPLYAIHYV